MKTELEPEQILRAGGILEADRTKDHAKGRTEVRNDDAGAPALSTISARAYRHPSLRDRIVVRLGPEALAPAEDLELELLGFGPGVDRGVVGVTRRRALGFPGAALVMDPERGRFALDVVKAYKTHLRLARTKPGKAKEGIDALGTRLSRSVPHFLPSFYEQAARDLLAAGATSYAASYFEKAREAERVHHLPIDEDQRRSAFVEFALAGAVSIKTLTAYAKELEKALAPAEAYRQFRLLAVQRTLGGMPPWSSMAKDLARLAKLAKLDPAAEAEGVIAEIIEAPSLSNAAGEFWRSYGPVLLAVARKSATARNALLHHFPAVDPEKDEDPWLDLLDASGAIDEFIASSPPGAPAAWFGRLIPRAMSWLSKKGLPPRLFSLLERCGDRLRGDAAPLPVVVGYRAVDLDFLDLALSLGVPVATPAHPPRFDLEQWAERAEPREHPGLGRSLEHLTASAAFAPALEGAIESALGHEPFHRLARARPALDRLRERWLRGVLDRAGSGALPGVRRSFGQLGGKRARPRRGGRLGRAEVIIGPSNARLLAEFPEQGERFRAIDLARALTRSLRGGIPGELRWPALDDALATLARDGGRQVNLLGVFPYIIASNGLRAIAVGPEGIAGQFDLRLPPRAELRHLRFVQGQLLTVFSVEYTMSAAWSGAPNDVFEIDAPRYNPRAFSPGILLADGSITEGGRALHAGDRAFPAQGTVFSDGDSFWVGEAHWWDEVKELRELDPRTGERGRSSLPRFLEDYATSDARLSCAHSWLMPLPRGRSTSPLGHKGGLIGWRTRKTDTGWQCEGIDGRRFEGALTDEAPPLGLLDVPAAARPSPILCEWTGAAPEAIFEPSGAYATAARDEEPWLPMPFWHYLEPRAVRGSEALRALDERIAGEWLESATRERPADGSAVGHEYAETRRRIAQLPGLTDPDLQALVLATVVSAADLVSTRAKLDAARLPEVGGLDLSDGALSPAEEHALDDLAGPFMERCDLGTEQVGESVAVLSAILRAPDAPKVQVFGLDLPVAFAGRFSALAFLAASPVCHPEARGAVASLLDRASRTVFVEEPARCRILYVGAESTKFPPPGHKMLSSEDDGALSWFTHGQSRYIAQRTDDDDVYRLVEYAPDGAFALPPGTDLKSERRIAAEPPELLRVLAGLLRERGAIPWDIACAERLSAATGTTRAEAAFLWAGLPKMSSYGSDFLGKECRATLSLKTGEANAARDRWRREPADVQLELLAGAIPMDPAELWAQGPEARPERALAAKMVARLGRRVSAPDALIEACQKDLPRGVYVVEALAAIADPASAPCLGGELELEPLRARTWEMKDGLGAGFTTQAAWALAHHLPYLFATLAVGDPIRANLPDVLARTRTRLASPTLLLQLAARHFGADKEAEAFLELIGGTATAERGRDSGLVLAIPSRFQMLELFYRPGHVRDDTDWKRLADLTGGERSELTSVQLLLSPGYAALAARVASTPVPAGQYEANPRHAAPATVDAVRARQDLGEDAAVLYLQTLTLLPLASKTVELWNGWNAARYKKAAAELVGRKLLVEAKRARAQRSAFLPGGWEALPTPHVPFESWKLPLYEITRDAAGKLHSPLGALLPLRPLHELFEAAWARVERGDEPRYEEAKR